VRDPSNPILNVPGIERGMAIIFPQGTRNQMAAHIAIPSTRAWKLVGREELATVNRRAATDLLTLVQRLLPGGTIRGRDYVVRNPKRADKTPR
jgi:hypothetical protein